MRQSHWQSDLCHTSTPAGVCRNGDDPADALGPNGRHSGSSIINPLLTGLASLCSVSNQGKIKQEGGARDSKTPLLPWMVRFTGAHQVHELHKLKTTQQTPEESVLQMGCRCMLQMGCARVGSLSLSKTLCLHWARCHETLMAADSRPRRAFPLPLVTGGNYIR